MSLDAVGLACFTMESQLTDEPGEGGDDEANPLVAAALSVAESGAGLAAELTSDVGDKVVLREVSKI